MTFTRGFPNGQPFVSGDVLFIKTDVEIDGYDGDFALGKTMLDEENVDASADRATMLTRHVSHEISIR